MPGREQSWVDSVKQHCRKCGIDYKLWNEEELREAFPDEPVWRLADKMPECVRRCVFLADYFRFIVVQPCEVYLDCDFKCNRKPSINFNGTTLLAIGEFWDSRCEGTAFIGVQKDCKLLPAIKGEIHRHLEELDTDCLDNLLAAFGPEYFRCLLKKLSIKTIIVNRSELTHIQWKNNGALVHMGAGSWV